MKTDTELLDLIQESLTDAVSKVEKARQSHGENSLKLARAYLLGVGEGLLTVIRKERPVMKGCEHCRMDLADHQSIIHNFTVRIICDMRGYAPEEVERWIDENNDDYSSDTASEYADISSHLCHFRDSILIGEE